MEEPKGNPNYDALFDHLTPIVQRMRSNHTPEQLREVYDCLVKHNETAEKAFLERLAERKKRKSLD